MIETTIFSTAIVGMMSVLASNPAAVTKLISDEAMRNAQAFQAAAISGYSALATRPDGTKSYNPPAGAAAFAKIKADLANNNHSEVGSLCGVVFRGWFTNPGSNDSVAVMMQAKEGGIPCNSQTPPAALTREARDLVMAMRPDGFGEQYVGFMWNFNTNEFVIVPVS